MAMRWLSSTLMGACSAWGAPLPRGEVEPIGLALPVAEKPRPLSRDRLPSKGCAWFHIRKRLRERKLANALLQELLAPLPRVPTRAPNKHRSLLPLPSQEDYYKESMREHFSRQGASVRRRVRRRVHKCERDVMEGSKMLVILAPKLRYHLKNEYERMNPGYGHMFHMRPREVKDRVRQSCFKILGAISMTVNTRTFLKRRSRRISPFQLASLHAQSCFESSTPDGYRNITSAVIHELYEEHGFTFDDLDIRNPPVLPEEGVWRCQ